MHLGVNEGINEIVKEVCIKHNLWKSKVHLQSAEVAKSTAEKAKLEVAPSKATHSESSSVKLVKISGYTNHKITLAVLTTAAGVVRFQLEKHEGQLLYT